MSNWRLSKRRNKCCYDDKNTVTVKDGWSYLCGVCGRYTYDFEGNQMIKAGSIECVGESNYYKLLARARKKIRKLKIQKTTRKGNH